MRAWIIYLFLIFSVSLSSQGFRARHYLPGTKNNSTKAIFETLPGNYITGGIIVDSVDGIYSNRLCLTGLDAQGQIQWVKKYGNSKFEFLDNPFISRSYYKQGNNVYYTGCVRDSNNTQVGVLIKFNLNGDSVWQKIYRDSSRDVIPQMLTGSVDGGFLITGWFQDWINNVNPCLLIKTDKNGSELWRKILNKPVPNASDGKSIIQDSSSKKIVIMGYQNIGNANSWSLFDNLLILDSLGNQIVRYDYLSPFGGNLLDMIQTRDKKIVMVGYKYYPQTIGGYNLTKSFAVKIDLNAPNTPIWEFISTDKLSLTNGFSCLTEMNNGDILVAGSFDTLRMDNLQENDLLRLTKISSNGSLKWNKYYDYKINASTSDNIIAARSINLGNDGSLIAAIECFDSPSPNPFFFVKWDSTGCDSSLAYCQMIAAGIHKNYLGEERIKLYPNPTSGLVTISFADSEQKDLGITVSDITGLELKKIALDAAMEEQRIDLQNLKAGMYILTISSGQMPIYKTKLIREN